MIKKTPLMILFIYFIICCLLGSALIFMNGIPKRLSTDVLAYANGSNDINPLREKCHRPNIAILRKEGGCIINNENKNLLTFLSFGDSFSATLLPTLDKLAKEYHTSGIQSSFSSCPPIFNINRTVKVDASSDYNCFDFNNLIKKHIHSKNIKNIILFARWSAYMNEYPVTPVPDLKPYNFQEIFHKEFIDTLLYFKKNNVNVWIVQQPPEYKENVPQTLTQQQFRGIDQKLTQSYHQHQKRQFEINKIFDEIQNHKNLNNVHFVNPARMLCPNFDKCITSYDGKSLYRDTNHLSQTGVSFIEPLLHSIFQEFKKNGIITNENFK